MKKLIAFTIILALALTVFAGCGKAELPNDLTEDKVYEAAQNIITDFNNESYQAIVDASRDDVKPLLTTEALKAAYDAYIAAAGKFTEFGKGTIKTTVDKDTEETYITVITVAEYENAKYTYTVNFNEELQIVGFIFK